MQCGEIKFRSTSQLDFDSMNAFKIEIDSIIPEDNSSLSKLMSVLSQNKNRNNVICDNVTEALRRGRRPLLLTERVAHLKILEEMLIPICGNIIVLKGNMKKKEKELVDIALKKIKYSDSFLIIATGKYIGEGFDFPFLDTLFLALPVSWKGTLQQYIGRIVRNHESKKTIEVYDFVDSKIDRIEKMYIKRRRAYKNLGFTINSKK